MAQTNRDLPRELEFGFDRFGGGPRVINKDTRESLTPQQIVAAYNSVTAALAELSPSDVD